MDSKRQSKEESFDGDDPRRHLIQSAILIARGTSQHEMSTLPSCFPRRVDSLESA